MSEEDSTVSPDLRIRQLEEDLLKEKDRLEKLYAGYTALKDAADEKDATIDVLERQMIDKEIEMEGMQELFSEIMLKVMLEAATQEPGRSEPQKRGVLQAPRPAAISARARPP